MKIASKQPPILGKGYVLATIFGICLTAANVAQAQMPPMANPMSAPSAPPIAMPPAAANETAPKIAPPSMNDTMANANMDAVDSDKDKGEKGLNKAEDKISDSVKNIVKHMNTTDSVTLDDLNSARQAVAKIDALIDIEKRLNELQKLRSEREGGGGNTNRALAAAIPASALSPLPNPMMMPMQATQPVVMPPPAFSVASLEVMRILGGNGHYSAMIKTSDGQTKTVQVGDKVSNGEVRSITAQGVEFEDNGKKQLVPVKNINTVFSNSP